ncbi:hypothetical protein EJB05_34415, partial [Eragrostis curvula]
MAAAVAVEMVESCMVTPGEATPQHALWLSNLDLAYRSYTPVIFLYRRPSPAPAGELLSAAFSPGVLKAALSRVLVPYYPLAGRLAPHRAGRRPEIHCTGEGVLFVTARADATLDDIGCPATSDGLRRMFVPSAKEHAGVTLFKCGGVCLGTAVHHMAADGAAFSTFLYAWAAIVRGAGDGEAPVPPCLDRTLLRARSPPAVPFHHAEYSRRVSSSAAQPNNKKPVFQTAILPVSRDQVKALKHAIAAAGNNNNNNKKKASATTFAAVVAHVWRCACISLPHQRLVSRGTEDTRLYVTADARSRVRPPLPTSYLGSAALRTSAVAKVDDVVSSPLCATAGKVAGAVSAVNDEYMRSLLDFMEIEAGVSGAEAGMRSQGWFDPETDLVVVSYFGVVTYSTLDFGWGCPTFFCRANSIANGYVHLVPCGDHINVIVAMEPGRLSRFKQLFYEELQLTIASKAKHDSKL